MLLTVCSKWASAPTLETPKTRGGDPFEESVSAPTLSPRSAPGMLVRPSPRDGQCRFGNNASASLFCGSARRSANLGV